MTKKLEKGLYEVRNETKRLGVYWKFEDKFRAQRHGKVESVETFNNEKECEDFITKGKKVSKSNKIKGVVKTMSTENYEKPVAKKKASGKKRGFYVEYISNFLKANPNSTLTTIFESTKGDTRFKGADKNRKTGFEIYIKKMMASKEISGDASGYNVV